jgi:hypothetical protein
MRPYKSIPDACYGMILLFGASLVAILSYVSIDFLYVHPGFYIARQPSIHYPMACLFAIVLVARWQLSRAGIQWWAYFALLLAMLYVMFFSGHWFESGLHDVALFYFDSHGRFGCHDERYESYIFRDDTAVWILFGSLVFATVIHWLYRRPRALASLTTWVRSFIRWSTKYEPRKTST